MSKDAKAQADKPSDDEVGFIIKNVIPDGFPGAVDVDSLVKEFFEACEPLEKDDLVYVFVDARTGARFCECHLRASKLIPLATTDVPIDPDEQEEYRANRDLVEDHQAFAVMKDDAVKRRSFSNLVIEYSTEYNEEYPLKVIGGQHRHEAIKLALELETDEYHGAKVYFGLNPEQRYDVQLISNTVIGTARDLYDRMQETLRGPELRKWSQDVGLLSPGEDFADKRQRGKMINVRLVRSFIISYCQGKEVDTSNFGLQDTTPKLSKSGDVDAEWERLRQVAELWENDKLKEAGRQFARLIESQRRAFAGKNNSDFAEKASNYAVVSGWAFVAGLLHKNDTRLKRHFDLADKTSRDPLNAAALIKGKHPSDGENYRGMGYRSDPKERARFVELFYLQAEKGNGISQAAVELAVIQQIQKKNYLEVKEKRQKYDSLN